MKWEWRALKSAHKIIFIGSLPSPLDTIIVEEKAKLLTGSGGLTALRSLFILYFVMNNHYPRACLNTFMYLQNPEDSKALPKKVVSLLNECE